MRFFSKISWYVIIKKKINFCFFQNGFSPNFNNSKVKSKEVDIYQAKFMANERTQNQNQIFASHVYQQFLFLPKQNINCFGCKQTV